MIALLAVGALLAVPTAVTAEPYQHTTQPTAQGSGGAAATVDSVATSAARDVLQRGGNAVDAAVAAAAVLGVTEPFSAGIGGGGFMLIRTPQGRITTIDSREKAPDAMRPDSFIENGVEVSKLDVEDVTIRYARLDAGTIVVTSGEDAFSVLAGAGPKLVDSEGYRRAAEDVGLDDRTKGFVYVDVDGMLPLIEELAGPLDRVDVVQPDDRLNVQALRLILQDDGSRAGLAKRAAQHGEASAQTLGGAAEMVGLGDDIRALPLSLLAGR